MKRDLFQSRSHRKFYFCLVEVAQLGWAKSHIQSKVKCRHAGELM